MTNPTARDLIQQLTAAAESSPYIDDRRLATKARRWLDTHPEPATDGPAVPDGREPASVAPQPKTVAPTDQDLFNLALQLRLYSFQPTAGDPTIYELSEAQVLCFARAVLTRWGHQPPQPIPLEDPPGQCPGSGS